MPYYPILFNALKHHLSWLQDFIRTATPDEFTAALLTLGASQMDLYCGELSVPVILGDIMAALEREQVQEKSAFVQWVADNGGFREVILSDGSLWVLRYSEREQYIHLHPGRYAAHCIRVKAGVLKTAVAWQYKTRGTVPPDLGAINELRKEIGLSPVKTLEESRHLMSMVRLLS
ncbi:hypothetical protein SAMN05444266_102378 [Chitinophaga jiangningensis]|uniref:Uncharacterized protein n=1 Tax=Chitinophaga jiangningensis TaxID=1419482 RepID=A0A1M6YM12_9BACT|nr:hypothetical protein [Chitinophaga jiangningensis]SHL19153.1 hypothetical protein SAMN05444266_102378 [Chitinophaga jiangningensis]